MKIKRLNLRSMSEKLSDGELKHVLGGYGDICMKCHTGSNCYTWNLTPQDDCHYIGDMFCEYGFACGPCSMIQC